MKMNKRVEEYDFNKAQRLLKSQIEPLQGVFEAFARSVGLYLSSELRASVSSKFLSLDEITYTQFLTRLENPTIMAVVRLSPLEKEAFLEINQTLTYIIIERLLGAGSLTDVVVRTPTEIELRLIERILKRFIDILDQNFRGFISNIRVDFERLEFNPQVVRICQDIESVITAIVEVRIEGGKEAGMSFCMPSSVIEKSTIDKLQTRQKNIHKFQTPQEKEKMRQNIDYLQLPVIVELGKTTITVEQLLQLQVGDVLRLDGSISEPLVIKLQDVVKFRCRPGVVGKRIAAQIIEVIEEE